MHPLQRPAAGHRRPHGLARHPGRHVPLAPAGRHRLHPATRKSHPGHPPRTLRSPAGSRSSPDSPECFAAIFDRYYVQIHGYAARRLGHSLADDVAAETFLIAFERRDRYDVSWRNARPWLYGITSNLVSGHHRAEERRYRALSRVSADGVSDEYADRVAQRVDAQARPDAGPAL